MAKKRIRKIVVDGEAYYWYITINEHGHRIHISSEDNAVMLVEPWIDTEVPVTPAEVAQDIRRFKRGQG